MKTSLQSTFFITVFTFVVLFVLLGENVYAAPAFGRLSVHAERLGPLGATEDKRYVKRQWPPSKPNGVTNDIRAGGPELGVRQAPPWGAKNRRREKVDIPFTVAPLIRGKCCNN
ncbi:hypothetical protein V8B97DRAFT_412352 [Scleroderma yunnanense]